MQVFVCFTIHMVTRFAQSSAVGVLLFLYGWEASTSKINLVAAIVKVVRDESFHYNLALFEIPQVRHSIAGFSNVPSSCEDGKPTRKATRCLNKKTGELGIHRTILVNAKVLI